MHTRTDRGVLAYRFDDDWAKLPRDVVIGDVGGVAVDAEDNVYVFNRGPDPMLVFDSAGNLLNAWGHDTFSAPHGARYERDGYLYLADDGDHTVRKCTLAGEVVLEIGTPDRPAPFMSGRPFNRCTHTALSPDGDIWVSDGYGNACIHRFTPDGRHLATFGASGSDPGEFYVPHNLCVDGRGRLLVADRENHRIQVFDAEGCFIETWAGFVRPMSLWFDAAEDLIFIGEAGPGFGRNYPGLGPRITAIDRLGRRVLRIGEGFGVGPGRFTAPHGICGDSDGNLYVGEVANAAWKMLRPDEERPASLRTLRRLTRCAS